MAWCEPKQIDYVGGLVGSERVCRMLEGSVEQARRLHESDSEPARFFTEFVDRALRSSFRGSSG